MNAPEIRPHGELTLVGYGTRFTSALSPDADNTTVIPALWERFVAAERQIGDRTEDGLFGACLPLEAEAAAADQFHYVAGAPVRPDASVPDGMEKHTIPAAMYAVFTHEGPVSGIGETMARIYRDWLPESGRRHGDGPELEYYDERFTNGPDSVMEIWIPVEEES
jgi:AraC family transcriptional regulator